MKHAMVIEYLVPGGLMVHFQVPFDAEAPGMGKYSVGPDDGSLLCPVHIWVAASLISKATEIRVYPDGNNLYHSERPEDPVRVLKGFLETARRRTINQGRNQVWDEINRAVNAAFNIKEGD